MRGNPGDPESRSAGVETQAPASSRPAAGAVTPAAPGEAVARFVGALARAVQAFHTYPPGSPARETVLEVARAALQPFVSDEDVALSLDVTGEGIKYEGLVVAGDRGPERSLARALRATFVSRLEFAATAPVCELRQLCDLLAFPGQLLERDLPEMLVEKGVTHIVVHVIPTQQTIEGGTVPEGLIELLRRNRSAQQETWRKSTEGGWIRFDPSVPLDRVGVEDLPLLLRDAPSLGVALHQLAGGSADGMSSMHAMVRHYGEIAELYASCDEAVADTLFRRLVAILRDMPDASRRKLLRTQALPDLIDGRPGGIVLRYFDDDELVGALSMLVDMGVGGTDMIVAGLDRLELSEHRRSRLLARVSRDPASRPVKTEEPEPRRARPIDEDGDDMKRRLTRDADGSGELVALHGFDLALDDSSEADLAEIVRQVRQSDPVLTRLGSCADILSVSADPAVVGSAIRRARGLFFELEKRDDIEELASWLARFARAARARHAHDEEVADRIRAQLDAYVTPDFIHRVSSLGSGEAGEPPLVTILCELGATGVGALVETLAVEPDRATRSRLLLALQPRAAELADHLLPYLAHPKWYVVRNLLTLFGHAGPGWEDAVADSVEHPHEKVVREAFFALARIGSPAAAHHCARALRHDSGAVRRLALDTLWRFDAELTRPLLRDALADDELANLDPELVRLLVVGASQRGIEELRPALHRLRWHAFAFWNPRRRALGWTAWRQLRAS